MNIIIRELHKANMSFHTQDDFLTAATRFIQESINLKNKFLQNRLTDEEKKDIAILAKFISAYDRLKTNPNLTIADVVNGIKNENKSHDSDPDNKNVSSPENSDSEDLYMENEDKKAQQSDDERVEKMVNQSLDMLQETINNKFIIPDKSAKKEEKITIVPTATATVAATAAVSETRPVDATAGVTAAHKNMVIIPDYATPNEMVSKKQDPIFQPGVDNVSYQLINDGEPDLQEDNPAGCQNYESLGTPPGYTPYMPPLATSHALTTASSHASAIPYASPPAISYAPPPATPYVPPVSDPIPIPTLREINDLEFYVNHKF